MEEALRRLVSKIIIPKYKAIGLEVSVTNITHEYLNKSVERYVIFFKILDLSNVDEDIVKSLKDDTISLMKSLGFYDNGFMNYINKGLICVIGSYS
jgi:hypothetical protein